MNKSELRGLLQRVLDEPMLVLQDEMRAVEQMSSGELARACGIPASNIRAVRNGQSGSVRMETWAQLMRYLLGRRGAFKSAA